MVHQAARLRCVPAASRAHIYDADTSQSIMSRVSLRPAAPSLVGAAAVDSKHPCGHPPRYHNHNHNHRILFCLSLHALQGRCYSSSCHIDEASNSNTKRFSNKPMRVLSPDIVPYHDGKVECVVRHQEDVRSLMVLLPGD